jgi:hypothetical protein
MKHLNVVAASLFTILLSTTMVSAGERNITDTRSIGHVSAKGMTLTDMTERLEKNASKMGGTSLRITSARAGNYYYGTAVVFK